MESPPVPRATFRSVSNPSEIALRYAWNSVTARHSVKRTPRDLDRSKIHPSRRLFIALMAELLSAF
jgi:hypothetical protein